METNHGRSSPWAFNGHQIETPRRAVRASLPEKLLCHALDVLLLLRSQGLFRLARLLLRPGSCFHFDESENRPIVAHEIDFAFVFGNSVIPRDEYIAVAPEIPVGVRLTANPRAPSAFLGGLAGARFGQTLPGGQLQHAEYGS